MRNSKYLMISLLILTAFSCSHLDSSERNHTQTQTETSQTQKKSSTHESIHSTEPMQALQWLKNGNTRFTKARLRNDGASQKDILRLSKGQNPHSIILSCSDSRVPPEVIFDQKLGEIFTVRTAGQVIEPSAIASMEYAVEHLGARNLIIMGHTNCGAVKAAFGTLDGSDAGSDNLNHLVHDIHPRIEKFKGEPPSKNYEKEGWANVQGIIKDISERSTILRTKIKDGEIKINGALYHLDTGIVEFQ